VHEYGAGELLACGHIHTPVCICTSGQGMSHRLRLLLASAGSAVFVVGRAK
jgi:hypothetical protein